MASTCAPASARCHRRTTRLSRNWSGSTSEKRSPKHFRIPSRLWRPKDAVRQELSLRKDKEMNNSQNTAINSSFVSIRYASSSKGLPDANKHETSKVPVIDVETLQSIRRIVE